MAVTIRLQRAGARNRPFYRVVVTDSRKPRDGAFLERVGYYDPVPDPDVISIEMERIDAWIGKGAQPSTAVRALIQRYQQRLASGTATPAAPPPAAPASEAGAEPAAEKAAAPPAAEEAAEAGSAPPEKE